MSVTILVPQSWSVVDKLLARRFRGRKATVLPAPWVEELMAKRFGCLMICGPCAVKYRDGISRWGYARHADMKVQGNACDFCKQAQPMMPLYFKEEHRYPTQADYAHQAERAVSPFPRNFQGDLRRRRTG